jgi:CO/xanthine dehydrogenase FAD-binding subunit
MRNNNSLMGHQDRTEYFFPDSIEQALEMKRKFSSGGQFIAGGTDLLIEIHRRRPEAFIDLTRIPEISQILISETQIEIGAGVTYGQLLKDPVFSRRVPIIGQAVRTIGGVQVRNLGTLIGNIVNASPAADTLPALYVLNALVRFTKNGSTSIVPIHEFITGPGQTILPKNELLVSVTFEPPTEGWLASYQKLGLRRSMAIAVVNVAVMLKLDHSKVTQIRIALGAVAPTVIRAVKIEEFLSGKLLNPQSIKAATELIPTVIEPIDDLRGSAEFRVRAAKGVLRRTLNDLRTRSDGVEG